MQLESNRLILRPASIQDKVFYFKLLNSPGWLQYIGDRSVHSPYDAQVYIETRMLSQYERLGFGNNTVILKSNGEKIGSCGLYSREGLDGVDIGFAFLPEYHKKGYAYEAASEILEYAHDVLKLPFIQGITGEDNIASQSLLEKLGLQYLETKQIEGIFKPSMVYRLDFKRAI